MYNRKYSWHIPLRPDLTVDEREKEGGGSKRR